MSRIALRLPERRPTTREIAAGLVVLAAAVLLAGFLLVVEPPRSEAARLSQQIADAQSRLALARGNAARGSQPVRAPDLFRLTQAMPDAPDMPGVLLALNGLADATGVTLSSIAPSPALPEAGYRVIPIHLVLDGNYYDLTDFLYRMRTLVAVRGGALEAAGRLFAVDSISFGPGAKAFPNVKAGIALSAYAYGAGAAAGASH